MPCVSSPLSYAILQFVQQKPKNWILIPASGDRPFSFPKPSRLWFKKPGTYAICTGSSLRGPKVPRLEVKDVLALNAEFRNEYGYTATHLIPGQFWN
jgi:hypothetical protein